MKLNINKPLVTFFAQKKQRNTK